MFLEFFDLAVHENEILMFKWLLAHYYKPTYRSLLKTLLAGPVMHVDDTDVKLKTGRGYIGRPPGASPRGAVLLGAVGASRSPSANWMAAR
jgi:hypothetical protein